MKETLSQVFIVFSPGRRCQTLKSPRGFASDWFSHTHVAVGRRLISSSILRRASSTESVSCTFTPYDCRTDVPGEEVSGRGLLG